jgi:hypothetical protein
VWTVFFAHWVLQISYGLTFEHSASSTEQHQIRASCQGETGKNMHGNGNTTILAAFAARTFRETVFCAFRLLSLDSLQQERLREMLHNE